MERSDKAAYEEAQKRLVMAQEDQRKMIPELRKKSRRDYLKKREVDKVEELEADIVDEEYLFGDAKLTQRERADIEYKKKVLNLAKDYKKAQDMSKVDHYVMPDQKKGETSAYVEVDDREKAPNAEQKKWEEEHLALGEWLIFGWLSVFA